MGALFESINAREGVGSLEGADSPHVGPDSASPQAVLFYAERLIRPRRMGVAGAHPEGLDDCCRYCDHATGVLGVMMTHVMGVRGEDEVSLDYS